MNQSNDLYCHLSGKVKHKSPADAHKAVGNGKKSGSTYKCQHCGQFHHTMFIDGLTKKKLNHRKYLRDKKDGKR